MNGSFMIKLAITSAFVAVPTIGATSMGISSTMKVSDKSASAKKAFIWAKKAEKALAKGQLDKASSYIEAAVEGDLQNIEYRTQLAQMYMSQGKFLSAERTWMDVMELGQVDPRTVISLSLSRIAQGKVESAVALVEANRSLIPVSDYGLTLALAGQQGRAIDILSEAIRSDNASARTRQNLALAYALDGRWRDARVMAVQDMSQVAVNQRIAEWAQYARPGAYEARVAGLLNVTPQADSGQPVRLALINAGPAMAAADVMLPSGAVAPVISNSPLPAIGLAPVAESKGFAASNAASLSAPDAIVAPVKQDMASTAVENNAGGIKMVSIPVLGDIIYSKNRAPLIRAAKGPSKQAGVASGQKAVVAAEKPLKLALADVVPSKASISGTYIVQLGAFTTSDSAKKAWQKFIDKYAVLSEFSSASSTVVVNGKNVIRLAAMGFDSKQAANTVCQSIKAKGGDCVVRAVSGSQPAKLALSSGRKVAAR
jgi:D-alanyl-D-alanine carboxypeptidase